MTSLIASIIAGLARESCPTGAVPDVVFGALDFTQVQAAFRLLRQDVRSEIVQAPKLIALG